MRLIWTSTNRDVTDLLCRSLANETIAYSLDIRKETDWNNEAYGCFVFSVWIQEETDIDKAKKILSSLPSAPVAPTVSSNEPKGYIERFLQIKLRTKIPSAPFVDKRKSPCSFFLFLLCIFVFVIDSYKDGSTSPTSFSRVRKELFFDYPASTQLLDSMVERYGPQAISTTPSPNPEIASLQKKLMQTYAWEGFYPYAVAAFTHIYRNIPPCTETPLFERLHKGEIWRLVTPAFLHGSLLHLIFNMSWLLGLGRQIERRISSWRYLLLIAICAAVSNIAQYLMSGPFFLGFSGVVCGFVGFIVSRQKAAPWEGYVFSQKTYRFLLWFIGTFVALSLLGFLQECAGHGSSGGYFANTAHVVGLMTGLLLGRSRVFRMTEYDTHTT